MKQQTKGAAPQPELPLDEETVTIPVSKLKMIDAILTVHIGLARDSRKDLRTFAKEFGVDADFDPPKKRSRVRPAGAQ